MTKWIYTGKETEPDNKNRVSLGSAIEIREGVRYRIMKNELGQILLDPVKSVPAYEAWVWENPDRIASIMRGVSEAEANEVVSIDLLDYEQETLKEGE